MQTAQVQPDRHSWVRTVIIGRNPRLTLIRIVLVVAVAIVVFKFILLPIRVDGPSMMPTYKPGAVNFVNRLAYWRHEPQRGDVVAVRYSGLSMMLMKRVVALPGETVEFINGQLFVNGQPVEEPYVKFDCDWNARRQHYRLEADEYYVVGDNRSMPIDLHYQGAAQRKRILGRVLL